MFKSDKTPFDLLQCSSSSVFNGCGAATLSRLQQAKDRTATVLRYFRFLPSISPVIVLSLTYQNAGWF